MIEKEDTLRGITRETYINELDIMRLNIEELPEAARHSPVTHADFASLLSLLSTIFRAF